MSFRLAWASETVSETKLDGTSEKFLMNWCSRLTALPGVGKGILIRQDNGYHGDNEANVGVP